PPIAISLSVRLSDPIPSTSPAPTPSPAQAPSPTPTPVPTPTPTPLPYQEFVGPIGDAWQGDGISLSIDQNVVDPGGTIHATVTIPNLASVIIQGVPLSYLTAEKPVIGCSWALLNDTLVDGQPWKTAGLTGNSQGLGGLLFLTNGLTVDADLGSSISLTPGTHVITFKLDPTVSNQYFQNLPPADFTGTGLVPQGPMVVVSGQIPTPNATSLEGSLTSAQSLVGFNIRPDQRALRIDNLQATPAEIDPNKNQSATDISATITPLHFTPTNLKWDLQVWDENGNQVKDLTGTGASVSAHWDASSAPAGNYSFELVTSCDEGIDGSAFVDVTLDPILPTVTAIKFSNNALPLLDDNGNAYPPDTLGVWYSADSSGNATYNPVVMGPPDNLIASASGMGVKTQAVEFDYTLPTAPANPIDYPFTVRDQFGERMLADSFHFDAGQTNASKVVNLVYQLGIVSTVTQVNLIVSSPDGLHVAPYSFAGQPIYLGLSPNYIAPLATNPPPTDFLALAFGIADGAGQNASTPDQAYDDARQKVTLGIAAQLQQNYTYDPSIPRPNVDFTYVPYSANETGGTYNYKKFKDKHTGDCHDAACLVELACAAVGVPMDVRQIQNDVRGTFDAEAIPLFHTNPVLVSASTAWQPTTVVNPYNGNVASGNLPKTPPTWVAFDFTVHCVAGINGNIWDAFAQYDESQPFNPVRVPQTTFRQLLLDPDPKWVHNPTVNFHDEVVLTGVTWK
ncbi:MAG: hypothetical protein ACYCOU_25065, partial [Sulfobacillus sp.]